VSTETLAKRHWWQRFIAPPMPASEMTSAQRRYDAFSSFPMFIAAMIWLLSTFFTWAPALQPEYRQEGWRLSVITWLIFAVDMVIRFILDPEKGQFLKRNWPLLVALAFPPLRIVLVITAVMRVAKDRNALTKIVGIYAVYGVLFVVLFGSVFTLIFEIDAPGANIVSYGDAVWWGFVTVTTVGYGDFYPVTVAGRIVAVFIMFTGAAAVGAVTAAVASRFITGSSSSSASNSTPSSADSSSQQSQATHAPPNVPTVTTQQDEATLAKLSEQINVLQEQIATMARSLDGQGATRASDGE
jgi:voltage-gated potassium channel